MYYSGIGARKRLRKLFKALIRVFLVIVYKTKTHIHTRKYVCIKMYDIVPATNLDLHVLLCVRLICGCVIYTLIISVHNVLTSEIHVSQKNINTTFYSFL